MEPTKIWTWIISCTSKSDYCYCTECSLEILISSSFNTDTHTHTHTHIYVYIYICVCVCVCVCVMLPSAFLTCKIGDPIRRSLEDSLFNIFYTEVLGKRQLLSLDCNTLPFDPYLIRPSVKRGSIKYNFLESLVWLNLRLNSGLPVNWQTLCPLVQWASLYL